MARVRVGTAVVPQTVENAGTAGSATDPRVVKFDRPARPVLVKVPAGFTSSIQIKINTDAANDFDGDSDDDGTGYKTLTVGSDGFDASFGGIVAVERIAIRTNNGGDDPADVEVVGWEAGQ